MNNDIDCPVKGWSIFYHTEFLVSFCLVHCLLEFIQT